VHCVRQICDESGRRNQTGFAVPQLFVDCLLNLLCTLKPSIFSWDTMGQPALNDPIENDQITADFQNGLNRLQQFVGTKIFIGAPNLLFGNQISQEMERRLWWNSTSMCDLNQSYKVPLSIIRIKSKAIKYFQEHMSRTKLYWDRLNQLKCSKCQIVDWTDAFCVEDKDEKRICRASDEKSQLAYFIDEHHYSFLGCRLIRPMLRKIAQEF
jgi:hypothetical protein